MKDIQNFAFRLWNDLRTRHLVPVAALLLAGLVAAPIVLSKKSEKAPAPTPAPAPSQSGAKPKGPEALAQVKLEDVLGEGNGSSLDSFDVNDPFAPPKAVVEEAEAEAQGGTVLPLSPGTGTTDTGTGTGTDTGGGTGGDTGGGTGGGGETDGGGEQPKTSEFAYVLDITFWANGRRRTIDGMEKLDMLPSQASPLLIFMGVTDGAGNAVFLVDSTLQTTGEGRCKPSAAECAFLYLGAGSEQEFTNDDGDSYRLRIDEIRKVKVGGGSGQSGSAAGDSKSAKSASAAVGAPVAPRRFSFPILTDVVVESGGRTDNSTGADRRR